ncbi:MAG TPA: (2Fe-2S)-binding protein [Thermomicrobiales bacterium]|jgi:isoquinoline 1-oxidoreductase alpha subunit|nr:(2Fe-2S)-binding protein [Thermomicrobiales bacterium]
MAVTLTINGKEHTVDVDDSTPLLWALRNDLGMTGTKFGCGLSQCGACTVNIDGEMARACITPVSVAAGKQITTVEGLGQHSDDTLSNLQQAWVEVQAPQCGYCQPGQLMAANALLTSNPDPSDDEIREAMAGNLCRCGTYGRIFAAIKLAASRA